jgi:hypothetical protein
MIGMKWLPLVILPSLLFAQDPAPVSAEAEFQKALLKANEVFDRLNAEEARRQEAEQTATLREIMGKLNRDECTVRWNRVTREWEVVKR